MNWFLCRAKAKSKHSCACCHIKQSHINCDVFVRDDGGGNDGGANAAPWLLPQLLFARVSSSFSTCVYAVYMNIIVYECADTYKIRNNTISE